MSNRFTPLLGVLSGRREYAQRSEGELLRRFVEAREEAAFVELVRRYERLVWRVARTATRQMAIADEVFQATFLTFFQHAGSPPAKTATNSSPSFHPVVLIVRRGRIKTQGKIALAVRTERVKPESAARAVPIFAHASVVANSPLET